MILQSMYITRLPRLLNRKATKPLNRKNPEPQNLNPRDGFGEAVAMTYALLGVGEGNRAFRV